MQLYEGKYLRVNINYMEILVAQQVKLLYI